MAQLIAYFLVASSHYFKPMMTYHQWSSMAFKITSHTHIYWDEIMHIFNVCEITAVLNSTHWGWLTHICLSKLPIIGSDSGLSHIKFVPRGPENNISVLVQIMAWRRPGGKPLSEPMMVNLLMHIWVPWPWWVKSLQYKHSNTSVWKYMG